MKIEIETNSKQKKKLIKFLKKKDIKFNIIENELPVIFERKVVDFGIKKTEKGWNEWLDKIVSTNIPKWFEFIGWLFLLGAMSFLAETTNNIYVRIIYAFSYVFLIIFMFRYFLSIDFRRFPLVKSKKVQLILSIILSILLYVASYKLIELIIPHFTS